MGNNYKLDFTYVLHMNGLNEDRPERNFMNRQRFLTLFILIVRHTAWKYFNV